MYFERRRVEQERVDAEATFEAFVGGYGFSIELEGEKEEPSQMALTAGICSVVPNASVRRASPRATGARTRVIALGFRVTAGAFGFGCRIGA